MSVHYKFNSSLDYDTITFDGVHISLADLKKAIAHQKSIGKSADFDLLVTNAQTKQVYNDDTTLIPKNTSVLVARIPVMNPQPKGSKNWRENAPNASGSVFRNSPTSDSNEGGRSAADLSTMDASEEEKIRTMMAQSTQDYDPSNYIKIRGGQQTGEVPPRYVCYRCQKSGHWIKNCPLNNNANGVEVKKSSGIPRSLMVAVEGPSVPGAMITPMGEYVVPAVDHEAYTSGGGVNRNVEIEKKIEIPDDLICNICKDILTDAVMIPCCGNSFCDDCIRSTLLESDEHECPDCHEKDNLPTMLIPNRYLRTSATAFRNKTGYARRFPTHKVETPAVEEQVSSTTFEKPPIDEKPVQSSEAVNENDNGKLPEADVKPAQETGQNDVQKLLPTKPDEANHSPKQAQVNSQPPSDYRNVEQYNQQMPSESAMMPAHPMMYGQPMASGAPIPTMAHGQYSMPYGVRPHSAMQPTPAYPPAGMNPSMIGVPIPSMNDYNRFPPAFDPLRPPPIGVNPYDQRGSRGTYYGSRSGPRAPFHPRYSRPLPGINEMGVVDDPLAAFERILREKDERRAKKREFSRRSRSRSYSPRSGKENLRSRSRTPRSRGTASPKTGNLKKSMSPRRSRSRSPDRKRRTFSKSLSRERLRARRSRSFSRSRSRSFSRSPGRDFPRRGRFPSRGRYRSPFRTSPNPRFRGSDFHRNDRRGAFQGPSGSARGYYDSTNEFERKNESRYRDYDEKSGRVAGSRGAALNSSVPPARYLPSPTHQANVGLNIATNVPYYSVQNHSVYPHNATRYAQSEYPVAPPKVDYNDPPAPPGTEEPTVPGFEPTLLSDAPPGVEPTAGDTVFNGVTKAKVTEKNETKEKKSISQKMHRSSGHRTHSSGHREVEHRKRSEKERDRREEDDSDDKARRKRKKKEKEVEKAEKAKKKKDRKHKEREHKDHREHKEKEHHREHKEKKVKVKNEEDGKSKAKHKEISIEPLNETVLPEMSEKLGEMEEMVEKGPEITEDMSTTPKTPITPAEDVNEQINQDEKDKVEAARTLSPQPEPQNKNHNILDDNDDNDCLDIHVDEDFLKGELDSVKKDDPHSLVPLSKWEYDEDSVEKESSNKHNDAKQSVTSDVIKHAENAIFKKITIKPIEVKSIVKSPIKETTDEVRRTPPPRISAKERLGSKVEDLPKSSTRHRRGYELVVRDSKGRHAYADRVHHKSSGSSLRRDRYVEMTDRSSRRQQDEEARRKKDRKHSERKSKELKKKHRSRSRSESKERAKKRKEKKHKKEKERSKSKKHKEDATKPGDDKSKSNDKPEIGKEVEVNDETKEVNEKNVKEKAKKRKESDSDTDSDSDSTSSDDERRKKKKKKHKKKRSKHVSSSSESGSDSSDSSTSDDSDSDTDSDSDDKKRKKSKKHKKKSKKSKKNKKSKH